MTYTTTINKTNVNKILDEMQAIRERGNYPSLMYNCRDKELFVDEFITATDYYNYSSYIKYISVCPTLNATEVIDVVHELQDDFDYINVKLSGVAYQL